MTDQELKELLQSFELDRSKVTDTYFLEMLADAEERRMIFRTVSRNFWMA